MILVALNISTYLGVSGLANVLEVAIIVIGIE